MGTALAKTILTWLPFTSAHGNLTILSYANDSSPGLFMWNAVRGQTFPTPVDNGQIYYVFVRANSDLCTPGSSNYVKSNTTVTTVTLGPSALGAMTVPTPMPWRLNPSLWQISYVVACVAFGGACVRRIKGLDGVVVCSCCFLLAKHVVTGPPFPTFTTRCSTARCRRSAPTSGSC